jgi:hypothetical protein
MRKDNKMAGGLDVLQDIDTSLNRINNFDFSAIAKNIQDNFKTAFEGVNSGFSGISNNVSLLFKQILDKTDGIIPEITKKSLQLFSDLDTIFLSKSATLPLRIGAVANIASGIFNGLAAVGKRTFDAVIEDASKST